MSDMHETFNYSTFQNLSPQKRGEAIAAILSSFVNGSEGGSCKAFVEAITGDHRTLQQLTFNLFLQLVAKWSEVGDDTERCHFDERNEFTVNMSQKIRDMFEEDFGAGTLSAPLI